MKENCCEENRKEEEKQWPARLKTPTTTESTTPAASTNEGILLRGNSLAGSENLRTNEFEGGCAARTLLKDIEFECGFSSA
jgi:hypothetical protein